MLLNKPKDYITTVKTKKSSHCVLDLLGGKVKEPLPGRRLDRATGMLLLTNDGELADKLEHTQQ